MLGEMQLWVVRISPLPNDGEAMTGIQARFAVFFGKVDQKRDAGWYWTNAPEPGEHGPFTGPFETKDEAVEHAIRSGGGRLH
jgi:hypothetical protein